MIISTWTLIGGGILLFLICISIGFGIEEHNFSKESLAECKLVDLNHLNYLRTNNPSEFIKEAEYIFKHLKNKRYSEFKQFRYGESKHGYGYYIVGYKNRFDSKRFFPHHNIMGDYMCPEYYLKTLDDVNEYYIDLLWRELNYMVKEKKRFDEYDKHSEL